MPRELHKAAAQIPLANRPVDELGRRQVPITVDDCVSSEDPDGVWAVGGAEIVLQRYGTPKEVFPSKRLRLDDRKSSQFMEMLESRGSLRVFLENLFG